MLVPGANIGIVILTNIGMNITGNPSLTDRSGVAQKIAFHFYDLYFDRETSTAQLEQNVLGMQELLEPASSQPLQSPSNQANALPLKSYCGVYNHPSYGAFTVSYSLSGNLVITMGPQKIQAKMVPAGGNTFWAYMPDIPAQYPMYIPFTFAFPLGGPATMTIGTVMGWPQNDVFTRIK